MKSACLKRTRKLRPLCDNLEPRALLSAMSAARAHVAAEVSHVHVANDHDGDDTQSFRGPILSRLPATPNQSVTTIPANGDQNPYGVALVPTGFPRGGTLKPGDVLVANFNNSMNLQGTGTTIVQITPGVTQTTPPVFFNSPEPGLTTALGVLKAGFVVVGNLPTTDGTSATVGQGSIQFIDRFGKQVLKLTDANLLDGPWDLTVNDRGNFAQVFVSNVLTGTVTRIDVAVHPRADTVSVLRVTQVASGYAFRTDPAALVLGPTGLAYDAKHDILYVASTADNAIYAIRHAGTTRSDQGKGKVIFADQTQLRGPVGLFLAPNGDLIETNGDAVNPDPNHSSVAVEFTPQGRFVAALSLFPMPDANFGLLTLHTPNGLTLATANDDTNNLDFRTIPRR
jgi:hypothetical protein